MKARNLWVATVILLVGTAGIVNAANNGRADTVPLADVTGPWLGLLKSKDPGVRNAAGSILVDIVRKHPAAAGDLVQRMAEEENNEVSVEHERQLVPLAKESPATVSAFIRLIRNKGTNYRVRNFGVKVLSQVGPAAATPEFVDALAETYCPVPGSFLRIMRAMGKDSAPILVAGFRHPDANVRKWANIGLQVIGRTEPTIQKLHEGLKAEQPLLQKMREGAPAERIAAIHALAEHARSTPGIATNLVNGLKDVSDKTVLAEAENSFVALGRESPEAVAALVAGVRSKNNYRVRMMAIKVLPKVGATLNSKETVEALGDHYCPVPHMMQRILLAAGSDALPVLNVALQHANPDIRGAAQNIIQRMPRPTAAVGVSPKP